MALEVEFAKPYFGDEEREAVNKVMKTSWLSSGPECEAFEKEFAEYIGVPHALAVNSGSSANLLALASLELGDDAVIMTSGCGFPATLSPILHLGLSPLLIDYDRETCNIDVDQVISNMPFVDAIILAHTMGNPVDMRRIMKVAKQFDVAVIEDCCESLGATLDGKQVGSFGECGTYSFYPSHQITALGGGGMVVFKSESQYHRAKSMRDWGKMATWDKLGHQLTSYTTKVDGIDYFPHYTYATVGHNMRLPDANCAFGREQLKRIDWIVKERNKNYKRIVSKLNIEEVKVPKGGIPSWFGIIIKDGNRNAFGNALEQNGIRHRPFFAGNITRHPPFSYYETSLPVADYLMENALFIGCWAGMTEEMCDHVIKTVNALRSG